MEKFNCSNYISKKIILEFQNKSSNSATKVIDPLLLNEDKLILNNVSGYAKAG